MSKIFSEDFSEMLIDYAGRFQGLDDNIFAPISAGFHPAGVVYDTLIN
jgi:hypothetical protein